MTGGSEREPGTSVQATLRGSSSSPSISPCRRQPSATHTDWQRVVLPTLDYEDTVRVPLFAELATNATS